MNDDKLKPKNISAWTEGPNTPESDMQPIVTHVVRYFIGDTPHEIKLPAECPMDAIRIFNDNFDGGFSVSHNLNKENN